MKITIIALFAFLFLAVSCGNNEGVRFGYEEFYLLDSNEIEVAKDSLEFAKFKRICSPDNADIALNKIFSGENTVYAAMSFVDKKVVDAYRNDPDYELIDKKEFDRPKGSGLAYFVKSFPDSGVSADFSYSLLYNDPKNTVQYQVTYVGSDSADAKGKYDDNFLLEKIKRFRSGKK